VFAPATLEPAPKQSSLSGREPPKLPKQASQSSALEPR
jgi:hypothetical protein